MNTDQQDGGVAVSGEQLLTVYQVADILNCSERHVYRLCDMGSMPRPLKIGASVRWRKSVVEDWIRDGCPKIRHVSASPRPR